MNLNQIADKYDAAKAEIEQLAQIEPELRSQAETLIAELSEKIDPKNLIIHNEENADPDTAFKMRTLQGIRTKIELIPGVRARLNKNLENLASLISSQVETARRVSLEKARAQIAALEKKLIQENLDRCGGDLERAKAAAAELIKQSELEQWRIYFDTQSRYQPAEITARTLHREIPKFEKGEPRKG